MTRAPFRLPVALAVGSACAPVPRDAADYRCETTASTHPAASELDAALAASAEEHELPGIVVAARTPLGTWSGAAGHADIALGVAMSRCQRLPAFSVTKTAVATAALRLVDEGRLDLDAPVSQVLDAHTQRGLANIERVTLRQLLGMRSGIPDYVDIDFSLAGFDQPRRPIPWRTALDQVRGRRALFAPDADVRYSNTNLLVVAEVIEAVSGRAHEDLVAELLLTDLPDTTYVPDETSFPGVARGYLDVYGSGRLVDATELALNEVGPDSGLVSDAPGLVALFDAVLRDGAVLSPTLVDAMGAGREDTERWYGLGVNLDEPLGRSAIGHRGDGFGYKAAVWFLPDDDITFVALANGSSIREVDGNLSQRVVAAREAVLEAVLSVRDR